MLERWRPLLVALILGGGAAVAVGVVLAHSALVTSGAIAFELAGILQVAMSGLFDRIMQPFHDDPDLPMPSSFVRRIIDNPDTPVRTGIRNALFFDTRTGPWLIAAGLASQGVAAWL